MDREGRKKIIATNGKARHDYHIIDSLEAGISLVGTEVKSIRQGGVNLKDSFCYIEDGQIITVGKARGSRSGNSMLVSQIDKYGGIDFSRPFALGYSGLSSAKLDKYIKDSSALYEGKTDLSFLVNRNDRRIEEWKKKSVKFTK